MGLQESLSLGFPTTGLFPAIWEKAPSQNWEEMID